MDGGMKAGDVITSFDGDDIADTRELVRRVGDTTVGEAVPVVVLRDGGAETLRSRSAGANGRGRRRCPPCPDRTRDADVRNDSCGR